VPFACVVCGIDGSDEALVAARHGARLLAPGGVLHLVAAVEIGSATLAGFEAVYAADQLRAEATEAIERVERELDRGFPSRLVDGPAPAVLLGVAEQEGASLVAVGAHRRRRTAELLLGSTLLSLLRDAPCSVLVAREADDGFPSRLLVGIDGSEEAARAAATAQRLAEQLGAGIAGVLALGGKNVDPAATQSFEVVVDDAHPVDALTRRAAGSDLVVVGSRGLHGLKALGSVSERVANRAPCSVLVVRQGGSDR
jgi:nucleotide-binding universal stress UspA family protein